ncbi:MAG: response regulator transcription factor, partial [Desulfotomaculum sp.]|nr:response regulator transcription factor [Desulfotomaculum sp.]
HMLSDELVIDSGKTAVYLKGRPVTLTAAEYRLLMGLVRSHGNFVPKNKLYCETVDDHAELGNDTALKTHIRRIRVKLGDNGKNPKYILCRKGYGYCLNEEIKVRVINKLP